MAGWFMSLFTPPVKMTIRRPSLRLEGLEERALLTAAPFDPLLDLSQPQLTAPPDSPPELSGYGSGSASEQSGSGSGSGWEYGSGSGSESGDSGSGSGSGSGWEEYGSGSGFGYEYGSGSESGDSGTGSGSGSGSSPMSVGGSVWFDANANGVRDAYEGLVSSDTVVGVTLTAADGTTRTTTTDEYGGYVFGEVAAGAYTLAFAAPAGYAISTPGGSAVGIYVDGDVSAGAGLVGSGSGSGSDGGSGSGSDADDEDGFWNYLFGEVAPVAPAAGPIEYYDITLPLLIGAPPVAAAPATGLFAVGDDALADVLWQTTTTLGWSGVLAPVVRRLPGDGPPVYQILPGEGLRVDGEFPTDRNQAWPQTATRLAQADNWTQLAAEVFWSIGSTTITRVVTRPDATRPGVVAIAENDAALTAAQRAEAGRAVGTEASNLLVLRSQADEIARKMAAAGMPIAFADPNPGGDGAEGVRILLPTADRTQAGHDKYVAALRALGLGGATEAQLAEAVQALYRGETGRAVGFADRYLVYDPDTNAAFVSTVDDFGASSISGDLSHVSLDRVNDLLAAGLAQGVDGYVYVAWVDVAAGKMHQIVLDPYRTVERSDPAAADGLGGSSPGFTITEEKSAIGSERPGQFYRAVRHVSVGLNDLSAAQAYANITTPTAAENFVKAVQLQKEAGKEAAMMGLAEMGLTFALHVVPFGAAADYGLQGKREEMWVSLAGDLATLAGVGVFAKLRSGATVLESYRGARGLLVASVVTDGGLAGYRASEGFKALEQGKDAEAAGKFGEALLRLIGVTPAAAAYLKARRAAAELKAAAAEAKVVGTPPAAVAPKPSPVGAEPPAVVAPGAPKFRSDLESHLTLRDSTVARSKGIGGAHNLDEFNKAASVEGIKITKRTPHPTLPGVEKIEYQIPALDTAGKPTGTFKTKPFEKTVYDPKKITDAEMVQWGKEAAQEAASRSALTREWTGTAKNGAKFRGYLDGAGEVRSFFPDF